jgi:hypothetical protein
MIAIACVVFLFVGAVCGYCIAKKQSQHAIFAARARGILEGRSQAKEALQRQRLDLQRKSLRIWQLEAKDQVIRREST